MSEFFRIYAICWGLACFCALLLFLKEPQAYALSKKDYWRFLFKPWKLATFIIAATAMVVIAPYTGDPTWDYFDAFFMAVLTFLSAPWAVGALYKVIRMRLPRRQGFVALCAWMFSASWSYDLYLLCRTGCYPLTWAANIFLSSILYFSAGLMWNLEWRRRRGVIFGFMEEDWPNPSGHRDFPAVFGYAIPFMALVFILVFLFVRWTHP